MELFLEFPSGTIVPYKNDTKEFKLTGKEKFIYLNDEEKNKFGFDYTNGWFFVNDKTFDFKINSYYCVMEKLIVNFKEAQLNIIENKNEFLSWNIGYKLFNEDSEHYYCLSITPNKQIFFNAKIYKDGKLFNEKKIELK